MVVATLFFGVTTLFLLLSKKFSSNNRSKFEIHKQITKECKAFDDAEDIKDIEFLSFLGTQRFERPIRKKSIRKTYFIFFSSQT